MTRRICGRGRVVHSVFKMGLVGMIACMLKEIIQFLLPKPSVVCHIYNGVYCEAQVRQEADQAAEL